MDITILIVAVLANIILGLFVFLRNRHSATNILFFFLNIDIVLWSIANYLATHTLDLLTALHWIRVVMFLAVPQAVIFFLLIHTLPEHKIHLKKQPLLLLLALSLITMILCLSPYLFTSVIFVNHSPSPTPGPAMPVFMLVAVGSVLAGLITLIKKFIKSRSKEKLQLSYIFVGVIIMFALIIFFNFVLVVFFETSNFVAISPLYTFPFIAATGYAIIKHRFLDVRLVVARTVSFTLVIVLFGLVYALLFSLLSLIFLNFSSRTALVVTSTLIALVIALTFQPVSRLIEKATDKSLYHDRYDQRQLLYLLTSIMATTLRFEDLTHNLLKEILGQMRVLRGAFILVENDEIYEVAHEGYTKPLELKEETIIDLLHKNEPLVFDELPEGTVKQNMREFDFAVIMPLRSTNKEIGLLALGPKQSGEIYFDDDINLLEIFVPEAAVAINNSLSYEEIKRFNVTLATRVEEATTQLRQANDRLLDLDKLKDEFVSLASHELRTPMASIRSYLWMAIAGRGGGITEKQKYYLDRAYSSTIRLIKLVNDMLNVSRIESGRLSLSFKKTDLMALVSDAIAEVRPKIEEHKINLKIDKIHLPEVIADPDKIKEVLVNLVGNSVKFTKPAGEINISFETTNQMVTTKVQDTGSGIAKDDIDKLFQKFSLVRSSYATNKDTSQGTGLGLYISKKIIDLHHGKIWAQSKGSGHGSTFSFSLKIYNDKDFQLLQKQTNPKGLELIHASLE